MLTFKHVVVSMGPDMPLQQCTTRQLRNYYIINNCIIGSLLPLTTCFWDIWRMSYIADSLNKETKYINWYLNVSDYINAYLLYMSNLLQLLTRGKQDIYIYIYIYINIITYYCQMYSTTMYKMGQPDFKKNHIITIYN